MRTYPDLVMKDVKTTASDQHLRRHADPVFDILIDRNDHKVPVERDDPALHAVEEDIEPRFRLPGIPLTPHLVLICLRLVYCNSGYGSKPFHRIEVIQGKGNETAVLVNLVIQFKRSGHGLADLKRDTNNGLHVNLRQSHPRGHL